MLQTCVHCRATRQSSGRQIVHQLSVYARPLVFISEWETAALVHFDQHAFAWVVKEGN